MEDESFLVLFFKKELLPSLRQPVPDLAPGAEVGHHGDAGAVAAGEVVRAGH